MKQITESYVSFEIAKLLKEKGFNESCVAYWDEDNNMLRITYPIHPFQNITNPCFFGPAAPTLQMALKLLREVHNQIIIIKYGNVGFVEESILQWWWELLNTKGELHACNIVDGNKSYEEACEDSILYVLKNLI